MSNNVGKPLFYVGIALFAIAIFGVFIPDKTVDDVLNKIDNTSHAISEAVTTNYNSIGGSATKRHKKSINKSKSLKRNKN
jgi:hypothetical protein